MISHPFSWFFKFCSDDFANTVLLHVREPLVVLAEAFDGESLCPAASARGLTTSMNALR